MLILTTTHHSLTFVPGRGARDNEEPSVPSGGEEVCESPAWQLGRSMQHRTLPKPFGKLLNRDHSWAGRFSSAACYHTVPCSKYAFQRRWPSAEHVPLSISGKNALLDEQSVDIVSKQLDERYNSTRLARSAEIRVSMMIFAVMTLTFLGTGLGTGLLELFQSSSSMN